MDGTLSTNKKEATYKKIIFFQKDQKYQIEDYLNSKVIRISPSSVVVIEAKRSNLFPDLLSHNVFLLRNFYSDFELLSHFRPVENSPSRTNKFRFIC